ncbi:MAG: hypothetical protein KDA61_21150 [Planctomycetales bacterium]|nr:hypothetical protein [Planctomycetales bacterium]
MSFDDRILARLESLANQDVDHEVATRAVASVRSQLTASDFPRQRLPSRAGLLQNQSLRRWAWGLATAAAAAALALSLWPQQRNAAQALAQVAEKASQTLCVRFEQVTALPGEPPQVTSCLATADGKCRLEEEGSYVTLIDVNRPAMAIIEYQTKRFQLIHGTPSPIPMDLYSYFRNMHKQSTEKQAVQSAGPRDVDGVSCTGYEVELTIEPYPPQRIRVWVDPATDLPVLIESGIADPAGEAFIESSMRHIRFDAEYDEEAFDFTPPDGFTVIETGVPRLQPARMDASQSPIVRLGEGLGEANFGDSLARVIELFGEPELRRDDDTVLQYPSRGFTLFLHPTRGFRSYLCTSQESIVVQSRTFTGKTAAGIGIGSTQQDLNAAFENATAGSTDAVFGTTIAYPASGVTFTLMGGRVVQFLASAPTVASHDSTATLQDIVDEWNALANLEACANQLQNVGSTLELGGVEGLTFSEAQFMALPPDQRAQLSTEVIDYIASVRTFFRALIAAGDEAFERGDDIASERYWQAALTLGKTLDQDGRMAILRQVGTALKRMANESLAKRPVLPAEPWAPAEAQPSSAQPVPRPSARESN